MNATLTAETKATSRPLGLLAGAKISESARRQLAALEAADLEDVREYLTVRLGFEAGRADAAIVVFLRYIALKLLGHDDHAIPDVDADHVWHAFLLFTRQYQRFCRRLGVGFIHHTPTTRRSLPRPAPAEGYWAVHNRYFPAPEGPTPSAPASGGGDDSWGECG